MNIIFVIVVIPLIVMAIFFLNGKGAFLIAGYNTASKEEKAKYDEKALCRFVGWLLIVISFSTLLIPAGDYFEMEWLIYCGIALIILSSFGAVFYMNIGKRFRVNTDSEPSSIDENVKSSNPKSTIIFTSVILVIVLIAMAILFYNGDKDPTVNILENRVQIKAMYGLNIDFTDITDISLIDKSMIDIGVGKRTNGYGGIGKALKGHFNSKDLGETLLFVQSKSSPTIRIERSNAKDIYISFRSPENTEVLYHELSATIPVK